MDFDQRRRNMERELKKLLLLALILVLPVSISDRASGATIVAENAGPMHLWASSVNVGATGDTAVPVPYPQYILRRVTLYGASANLATSTATLGVYTSTGGGGTELVAAGVLTGATGSAVVIDFATPAIGTVQTAPVLYLRIVQGLTPVAGSIKAVLDIQPLP